MTVPYSVVLGRIVWTCVWIDRLMPLRLIGMGMRMRVCGWHSGFCRWHSWCISGWLSGPADCPIYMGSRRLRGGGGRWRVGTGRLVHALLELADAAAESPHHLRQFASEEQQADEQEDQPMGAAAKIE
jgi:hypothetical protein